MIQRCFLVLLTVLTVNFAGPQGGVAQSQYSPELQVGGTVITRYQIDERARFLGLLGAPGDVRALAREQLINEAIQLDAARAEGIEVPPQAVEEALAEFAARANLTADQFREITQRAGISAATVRDFFTAGVAWRETVRTRFGDELRSSVSADQIRRAQAQFGTEGGLRVLISEILLPTNTPENQLASQSRAAELARITSEAEFAAAARRFSIASTASRGGALDWVALETLPEQLRATVAALTPGQVSRPVTLENTVGVFLLRDVETVAAGTPETLAIDYALFIVGGGAAEANRVARDIDVCDDLYGIAKGLPEDRLTRETVSAAQLPGDVRAALAGLDDGESTTALTRGGNATILMLCERKPALESTVDANIVANRLLNTRLGTTAVHYLTELRANTEVIDFTN